MRLKAVVAAVGAVLIVAVLASCGSGDGKSGLTDETTATAPAPSEAESAATGDIPDNQAFLVFRDPSAGYSIRYPEGWARKGQGNDVTFKEKANLIHIVVKPGTAQNKSGEKRTVTRQSAPDPVTGKRLPLGVDVYEFERGGKVAVLELSTPEGVDNVDAYRLISESFAWR
jgi:hypothetical protein